MRKETMEASKKAYNKGFADGHKKGYEEGKEDAKGVLFSIMKKWGYPK